MLVVSEKARGPAVIEGKVKAVADIKQYLDSISKGGQTQTMQRKPDQLPVDVMTGRRARP